MGLALLKQHPHDRFAFLLEAERELVEPRIRFVEERLLPTALPSEQAFELYRRACHSATGRTADDLNFYAQYEHWSALGASEEMILAACSIILARQETYQGRPNVSRAIATVLKDFTLRQTEPAHPRPETHPDD